MAKSSFLLGRTVRCTVHFVPSYNKKKKVISILRNRVRGAYSRDQEFPFFTSIEFCYFDATNREDIFASTQKKFCKLRDIGLFQLNVCSKILRYSYQKFARFLKQTVSITKVMSCYRLK